MSGNKFYKKNKMNAAHKINDALFKNLEGPFH